MVWVLVYGSYIHSGPKSLSHSLLLLWWFECRYRGPTHRGGKSPYDWLLVKIWLNINVLTEAHLFSVPNDCLWYDKLWGPSQRVVTLFLRWRSWPPGGGSRSRRARRPWSRWRWSRTVRLATPREGCGPRWLRESRDWFLLYGSNGNIYRARAFTHSTVFSTQRGWNGVR